MKTSFQKAFHQLTGKAHVYPPMDLYTPLSLATVQDAWRSLVESSASAPLGVYIHLPFCARKCSFCYCDTLISGQAQRHEAYVDAVLRELSLYADVLCKTPIDTLYLGGGTPTYIGVEQLKRLFDGLWSTLHCTERTHVNVESTPGSVNAEMAALLGAYSTDRVTLGIQSLDEQILSDMNRPQTFEQIETAVSLLRDSGVGHINFDLVGGLTHDTAQGFRKHFARLLSLRPEMVHVYPYQARTAFPESPEKAEILVLSREMVREFGYRSVKNDGWGLSDESANKQVKDKIERAGSCLGLGTRSRSHVFGRLAYRTVSGMEYEGDWQGRDAPVYHGFSLKLRHQVQRFLIDNLRQGVSPSTFAGLFGGDLQGYLLRYAPQLLPFLEERGGEIRCKNEVRSDRFVQQHLFDPSLRKQLFLHHIGQPKGWPERALQDETQPETPDWNWLTFLAKHLTKGNTYPPITGEQRVLESDVEHAWTTHAARVQRGEVPDVVGIYCHVPFCATKCKFCYCYSITLDDKDQMTSFVRAVQRQIVRLSRCTKSLRFNTLYFGGGTPSLLPPHLLDELLGTIHAHFTFKEGYQFNFEGTPQTLGIEGRIPILAKHGVSRLTIGIQSLEKHLLVEMDRAQPGRARVGAVIEEARTHGIQTINVDLMAGLPGQTLEDFQRTFEEVLRWRPEVLHPYPYQNTTETRYYQEGVRIGEESISVRHQMLAYARRRLKEANYQQVPNESWCLGVEHRNQQDVDKVISSSSVLPLGYVARGHVFGALTYGTVAAEYQAFMEDETHREFYYGHLNTVEDEQVRYVISNLRSGFSRVDFEAVFGVDCVDQFYWQFALLQRRGKIRVTALNIESLMTNSLDCLVHAKLFFSEEQHKLLREKYREEYRPEIDYAQELASHYDQSF